MVDNDFIYLRHVAVTEWNSCWFARKLPVRVPRGVRERDDSINQRDLWEKGSPSLICEQSERLIHRRYRRRVSRSTVVVIYDSEA